MARRARDRRGPGWSLQDVSVNPHPVQDRLPVWIGARSEAAVRRAVELGDWFDHLHGDRDRAEGAVAAGPVDSCVEFIRGVVDAGARLVILSPVADDALQIRCFVEELVPAYAG